MFSEEAEAVFDSASKLIEASEDPIEGRMVVQVVLKFLRQQVFRRQGVFWLFLVCLGLRKAAHDLMHNLEQRRNNAPEASVSLS